MTKKLNQEFSKTESLILNVLFQLDEFVLNPQDWVQTSHNLNRENQEANEDRSQDDPHPEVGVSLSQSSQEFSPDETSYSSLYTSALYRQKLQSDPWSENARCIRRPKKEVSRKLSTQ